MEVIDNNYIDKLMRLRDVLDVLQISRSTWQRGVAAGRFPKGITLSAKVIAWRSSDIKNLINKDLPPAEPKQ